MSAEDFTTNKNSRKRKRNHSPAGSQKKKRNQNPAGSQKLNKGTSNTLHAAERVKKHLAKLKKLIEEDMGKSENTYVYPPLDEARGQEIRVLVIEKGEGKEPIKCRLVPSALPNSTPLGTEAYPYMALSYYWGEGEPIHDIEVTSYKTFDDRMKEPGPVEESVFILRKHKGWRSSGKIYVRSNLYVALRRFRKKNRPTTMWVDALCIDQGDKFERSAQVKKMHELYIQAENVTIWLGDGSTANTPAAKPKCCFKFLRQILNNLLDRIEEEDESSTIEKAKYIVDLMCNKWFSRRWTIQELALARTAQVAYGTRRCLGQILQTLSQYLLKANTASVRAWSSCANELVDFINNLFRRSENGDIQQRMMTLEALVSNLLAFEATNPRDTIYSVLSLAKDTHHLSTDMDERLLPAYQNCLLDVYTDFIEYCIHKSQSLDILLRHWAPSEKRERLSEIVNQEDLPTWIPSIHKSSYGAPSQRPQGRSNGDSFVGTSIRSSQRNYSATLDLLPEIEFGPFTTNEETPKRDENKKYSGRLFVQGLRIGKVEKISPRAPEAMIFKEAFSLAGFDLNWWRECQKWAKGIERVPEGFWRTIVADRGPEGTNPPSWYPRACLDSLKHLRLTGDLRPDDVIELKQASSISKLFLGRVRDVLWQRRFVCIRLNGRDKKTTYGLTPKETEPGDIICVFFGCSVPVVLRPDRKKKPHYFHMVGECFVYGMMDGEAVAGQPWTPPYTDATRFELRFMTSIKKNSRSTQRSSLVLRELDTRPEQSQETERHCLEFKQRNIFTWYEDNPHKDTRDICSPDAGRIFTSNWHGRLMGWDADFGKKFGQDIQALYDRVDSYKKAPEDLELGLFFLAHPISAFALWHVLRTCYKLDKRICGTSKNDITEWKSWRPFQYLLSTEIVSRWEINLDLFSSEVKPSANKSERAPVAMLLAAILEDLECLEQAFSTLMEAFKATQTGMPCPHWMLVFVRKGVNNRFRAIQEHITFQISTQ
ncbi:hypothetical protein B7494_g2425 [Chlorociboria aeruginascens]|nr:hypothetical protein B7494_g2425 [Chlorociboria aeruginascens]